MFAVMSLLGGVKIHSAKKSQTLTMSSVFSFLIAATYGFVLEYFQTFIPQRAFDYADLTANVGGATLGIVIFLFFKSRFKS
jgi:VanZ family protein